MVRTKDGSVCGHFGTTRTHTPHHQTAKLCSFFAQYESKAKNVQKALMKVVGMDVGPSRLPKTDLSEEERTELEKELRALKLLQ